MKRNVAQMFLVAVSILLSNMCIPQAQAQSWNTMTSGTDKYLLAIWGTSATDVFAVGNLGIILHYNGTAWLPMSSGISGADLTAVWGISPAEVYAVGFAGNILKYNGTNWSSMTSNVTAHIYDIWGSSASDIYAVGAGGMILHYDGITWSTIANPGSSGFAYRGIWGSSATDIFIVVDSGMIRHSVNGTDWTRKRTFRILRRPLMLVWQHFFMKKSSRLSGISKNLISIWQARM